MQQVLDVSGWPAQRRLDLAADFEADARCELSDTIYRRAAYAVVADDALGRVRGIRLELWLDQWHNVRRPAERRLDTRQYARQRDEGRVDHSEAYAIGQHDAVRGRWLQSRSMCALHGNHPRIRAQRVGELSVTHVESIDAGGAAAQQHIGESAGRRPDVEADSSLWIDAERVERGGEFLAAARDIRRALGKRDVHVIPDRFAGFQVAARAVTRTDSDLACQNEPCGGVAVRSQSACDDEIVEPNASRSDRIAQAVRAWTG